MTTEDTKKCKNGNLRPMPFDKYCPSMENKIESCICQICGQQWPSAAAKIHHLKVPSNKKSYQEKQGEEEEKGDV